MPPSKGSKLIVRSNGLNIEDIFSSPPPPPQNVSSSSSSSKSGGTSTTKSSSTKGASSNGGEVLALTPRSAEACLMEGIDPKDLYERAMESFGEGSNLDPAIIRMVSCLVIFLMKPNFYIICPNLTFHSLLYNFFTL